MDLYYCGFLLNNNGNTLSHETIPRNLKFLCLSLRLDFDEATAVKSFPLPLIHGRWPYKSLLDK